METWKNLQKGFTANECLSGTYVDADVWHVCTNVARLHQKASQIEKASHIITLDELWDDFRFS